MKNGKGEEKHIREILKSWRVKMYITSVTIRNFKNIEDKEIQFKPGFNLIKGVNGKGKTSILEAIAVGLGGFVEMCIRDRS